MITFGLLFPFIGNMVFLSVTGGWNKDPDEEEEEEEEESGEAKSEVSFKLINFRNSEHFIHRKEKRKA